MSSSNTTTSTPTDSGRGYHNVATGNALVTVKSHEKEADIILFGANFCPFVQRVWVVFEVLGIPYKVFLVPLFSVSNTDELVCSTVSISTGDLDPNRQPRKSK